MTEVNPISLLPAIAWALWLDSDFYSMPSHGDIGTQTPGRSEHCMASRTLASLRSIREIARTSEFYEPLHWIPRSSSLCSPNNERPANVRTFSKFISNSITEQPKPIWARSLPAPEPHETKHRRYFSLSCVLLSAKHYQRKSHLNKIVISQVLVKRIPELSYEMDYCISQRKSLEYFAPQKNVRLKRWCDDKKKVRDDEKRDMILST